MDDFILALCAWRENRHGQTIGMQSVINSVMNRVKKRGTTPYIEVTKYKQYSSITAPGDKQLGLYPGSQDPQWKEAQSLARAAIAVTLEDITQGSSSYYAISLEEEPYWAPSMTKTVVIAGQQFLK